MAVGPILTQGLGSFGSVNLMPTLGFGIGAAADSVAGIEYRANDNRLHYTAEDQKLHYRSSDNRIHYKGDEQ